MRPRAPPDWPFALFAVFDDGANPLCAWPRAYKLSKKPDKNEHQPYGAQPQ
jgi:hypothetical protein